MADILQKLAAVSAERAERDKALLPPGEMIARCAGLPDAGFTFELALQKPGISFIGEIKRASPSRGLIAEDFPYREIAGDYAAAGADAISVLTEPEYFLGSDDYLREIAAEVALPVLRKDFIVDPYQVCQARLLGASAVLLICKLLEAQELQEFLAMADVLGLSALVEAHDAAEVDLALRCGARVIGVNNRDLQTFTVDVNNCLRLRRLVPPDIVFVAESGIGCRADVEKLEQNGVDAVLIGETLMRASDRRQALRDLRGQ
jgi:indole-3-glycerol phosphate synthase